MKTSSQNLNRASGFSRSLLISAILFLAITGCRNTAHLSFLKGDLEYNTKQVTQDEAQKMGSAIVRSLIFNDQRAARARLEKPDSIFVLSIASSRPNLGVEVTNELKRAAIYFSEDALNGAPLDVQYADSNWEPMNKVHYRSLGNYIETKNASAIFYTDAAGLPAITLLLAELDTDNFFKHGPRMIRLDKNASGYIWEVYGGPEAYNSQLKDQMREAAAYLSDSVFKGVPVTFEACDITMTPFLVISP